MAALTTARPPRVKPTALAAASTVAGQCVGAGLAHAQGEALPVLRFIMPNGVLELADSATVVRLLEHEQAARLAAEAEQAALATVYRLGGEPDEARPYGGLLTRRLDISLRTAQQLLADGKLRYTCAGKKNYRISERAVREYLGDLPPPA